MSVANTVKTKSPSAVGVPERTPVGDKVNPVGNVPFSIVNV